MNRKFFVIAIVLGVAACSTPGPEVPESNQVAASGVVDEDVLICKTDKRTGSLMKKETCLTAAEWERVEEGAREFMYQNRLKGAVNQ